MSDSPKAMIPDLGPVSKGLEARSMAKSHRSRKAMPPVPSVEEPKAVPTDPAAVVDGFHLKPHDVKKHLDRFVIRQDEAKKVLSVALCDHYQHIRMSRAGDPAKHYAKQNVLLLGPTGVGKTHLIRSAAELIGVPFVKADATKFSETGYVGGDVEDLVRDLLRRANGNVELAEQGIIYLDEIDKIASSGGTGRDVSGRGVQTNLLKLMEDGDVPVVSPNDVMAQVQSIMKQAGGGASGGDVINTRHILFIVSGAFAGLEPLIRGRLAGLGLSVPEGPEGVFAGATTADYVSFGLEPEFVGRLPVRVALQPLSEGDLYDVMQRSESSLLRQYERAFRAYGITLEFRADGLRRIARMAAGEQTGARGLMTVCERVLRGFKFELPSSPVRKLVVNRALVEDPAGVLKSMLKG